MQIKKLSEIDKNILAYIEWKQSIDTDTQYFGKWVIFRRQTLISIHEDFQSAAQTAANMFGRGPYLIRQIGQS